MTNVSIHHARARFPLKRRAAAIAAALTGLSGMAQAQAAPPAAAQPVGVLPAVTVTGNWLDNASDEKVLSHPGARSVVERPQIEESGASSVRDVLRQIPGVQVLENNGTGGSDVALNVGVRGLTARLSPRSTILMDGVPVAYAPYGQPQLSLAPVSLGNLESVDVVRGAGSVRYGPQNVGGIINFVTRQIPQDVGASLNVGSEISHGGKVKTTPSLFVGGTTSQGLGGALLYSGIHGKGYRSGNDATDIDDVMLKGAYRFSATDDVAVSLHHFDGVGRMPGGLTTAQYAQDPFEATRQYDRFMGRRTDGSLKYTHNDGINNVEFLTYYVKSYRSSYIEQAGTGAAAKQFRLTNAPRRYHYFGIEPRYSRLFDSGAFVQEVSIGYRYLKENSAEVAGRTAWYTPGVGKNAFDLEMDTYQTSNGGTTAHAFYIDDRIDLGNWTITPGVRYENIRTHNDVTKIDKTVTTATPSVDSHVTLPTLSVLYRIHDGWSVFANAGKSFGPQQYGQLASATDGLHPETAKTYEVGTHFAGAAWHGEFTLFNIDFDEELQLTKTSAGDGLWTNLGATRHRGVESALRYDLGSLSDAWRGLSVSATYTYTQATNKTGEFAGRDLPLYSRQVMSVGARYAVRRWTFNADLFAQSLQRQPGSPNPGASYITEETANGRQGDIPGFATVALRAGYDFGREMHDLKLALGVKNLFDRRYFVRSIDNNGGKFVGLPRTIYLQASAAF